MEGLGDFIGIGRKNRGKDFWKFKKARSFVQSLGVSSVSELRKAKRNGEIPSEIPSDPAKVYEEWISWGDWLGTYREASGSKELLPFKEARKFARGLRLSSSTEWADYLKKNPNAKLVRTCDRVYKDDGWKGWSDFLGSETDNYAKRRKVSYMEARDFLQDKGFQSRTEYVKALKKNNWDFLYSAP